MFDPSARSTAVARVAVVREGNSFICRTHPAVRLHRAHPVPIALGEVGLGWQLEQHDIPSSALPLDVGVPVP